jgi:tripartite-type tricarboxylate transporter receptor subunit TctC
MVAPPGTPPALATKISQDVAAALKQPDVAKKFADLSIEPIGGSPAELTAFIAKEREQWGKVIRRAGIQVN